MPVQYSARQCDKNDRVFIIFFAYVFPVTIIRLHYTLLTALTYIIDFDRLLYLNRNILKPTTAAMASFLPSLSYVVEQSKCSVDSRRQGSCVGMARKMWFPPSTRRFYSLNDQTRDSVLLHTDHETTPDLMFSSKIRL